MISVYFQGKPFDIMVIQLYAQQLMPKKLKLNRSMKIQDLELTPKKKKVLFIIGDQNGKIRSHASLGITG